MHREIRFKLGWALQYCFVTIRSMQSFDTENTDLDQPDESQQLVDGGRVDDLPAGSCKPIDLPGGRELALYNVNGEFYATENFCPHRGARLVDGILCGHVIECELHGWQFDVRNGECLTVTERLKTFEVVVEEGWVKVLV
jgi:nitrite reductase/ring-hydroxylating ferredoxin subunit